ncbi:MAG: hypothetical protein DRG87_12095 [Deltaproteobacteria bacterium]|nr:MAG: hypothetical protein DRG87_12095 [Deltaproteobacteria bacterium]
MPKIKGFQDTLYSAFDFPFFLLQSSIIPILHYETRIGPISKDERHIAGLTLKHKVRHAGR